MRPSQTQLVVEMKESRPLSESLCIYRAKKEPEEIAYCAEKWRQTKWNRDKLFSSCHWCPLKKANVFDNFQVSHYIFHTDIVTLSELGHSCAVYQLQGHRASPCSCHQGLQTHSSISTSSISWGKEIPTHAVYVKLYYLPRSFLFAIQSAARWRPYQH